MIVFLDTEFTDLLRPELLSVGLVTVESAEFYAELDLDTIVGQTRAGSDSVRYGGVLELWGRIPGAVCHLSDLGSHVGLWLLDQAARSSAQRLEVAFNYSTDYELMEDAISSVTCGTRSERS